MNRLVKILLGLLAVLVALVVVAAVALPLLFDPNDHKDRITAVLESKIGREVSIPGDIHLSVFPWLGMNIGRVTIANAEAFGDRPMAEIESGDVHVRLLPLLQQRIEIGAVSLDGLRLRLARNAEGRTNWDDIIERLEDDRQQPESGDDASTTEPGGMSLSSFEIGAIDISDAAVSWDDAVTGNSYRLSDFKLSTGRLTNEQPFRLEAGALLAAPTQGINSDINLIVQVQPNISEGFYRFSDLGLNIVAEGEAVPGDKQQLGLSGSGEYDAGAGRFKLGNLVLQAAGLTVTGYVDGSNLDESPVFNGRLTIKQFDPRAVMGRLAVDLPATQNSDALSSAGLDAQFDVTPERAEFKQILLTLDDSTLKGSAGVQDFETPAIAFDLSLDELDVDDYLPPGSAEQTQSPDSERKQPETDGEEAQVDLSALEDLRVDGKLEADSLTVGNMMFSDASLVVEARDGVLTIAPLTAGFYEGNIRLAARVDVAADTPQYALQGNLNGLQFAPLLQDVAGTDKVSALANMSLDLSTAGSRVDAMKRALDGQFGFELRDGAFSGFNLAKVIAAARSRVTGEPADAGDNGEAAVNDTPFNRFAGAFSVNDGVVAGDDLKLDTPYLDALGVGQYDLVANALDYTVNVRIDQDGSAVLSELAGVTVPVELSGSLLSPNYNVDIAAALEGLAAQRLQEQRQGIEDEVRGELDERLEELDGGLRERIESGLSDLLGGAEEAPDDSEAEPTQ